MQRRLKIFSLIAFFLFWSCGWDKNKISSAAFLLASIEYADSQSTVHKAEYIYNGFGFLAQIKKYENSTPTGDIRLIRSGYLTIQERDANNQVIQEYTWGKNMGGGIGGLLSMSQSGSLYTYLYDGRGNVSALLNTGQQVAASYRYDAFGNLMAKTGTLDQPYMFSTKRYDPGTGLSYYGYRFYNPAIGKWLTRDPIGEVGGINLYGFVLNDPVNWVDPLGLRPLTASEKGYLASYLPKRDLDNADIHVGKMPWYSPKWAVGITRGNDIYFKDPNQTFNTPSDLGLLGHELVHVGQYAEGMTWLSYLWASRNGYENNPFEVPAYEMQRRITRELKKRYGKQCP